MQGWKTNLELSLSINFLHQLLSKTLTCISNTKANKYQRFKKNINNNNSSNNNNCNNFVSSLQSLKEGKKRKHLLKKAFPHDLKRNYGNFLNEKQIIFLQWIILFSVLNWEQQLLTIIPQLHIDFVRPWLKRRQKKYFYCEVPYTNLYSKSYLQTTQTFNDIPLWKERK